MVGKILVSALRKGVVLRGGGFVVVATVIYRVCPPPLELHHPWYNRFAVASAARRLWRGHRRLLIVDVLLILIQLACCEPAPS